MCHTLYDRTNVVVLNPVLHQAEDPVTLEGNLTTFAKCYKRIEIVQLNDNIVNQHGSIIEISKIGPEKAV